MTSFQLSNKTIKLSLIVYLFQFDFLLQSKGGVLRQREHF